METNKASFVRSVAVVRNVDVVQGVRLAKDGERNFVDGRAERGRVPIHTYAPLVVVHDDPAATQHVKVKLTQFSLGLREYMIVIRRPRVPTDDELALILTVVHRADSNQHILHFPPAPMPG